MSSYDWQILRIGKFIDDVEYVKRALREQKTFGENLKKEFDSLSTKTEQHFLSIHWKAKSNFIAYQADCDSKFANIKEYVDIGVAGLERKISRAALEAGNADPQNNTQKTINSSRCKLGSLFSQLPGQGVRSVRKCIECTVRRRVGYMLSVICLDPRQPRTLIILLNIMSTTTLMCMCMACKFNVKCWHVKDQLF